MKTKIKYILYTGIRTMVMCLPNTILRTLVLLRANDNLAAASKSQVGLCKTERRAHHDPIVINPKRQPDKSELKAGIVLVVLTAKRAGLSLIRPLFEFQIKTSRRYK